MAQRIDGRFTRSRNGLTLNGNNNGVVESRLTDVRTCALKTEDELDPRTVLTFV
jgi:hypothetical protein